MQEKLLVELSFLISSLSFLYREYSTVLATDKKGINEISAGSQPDTHLEAGGPVEELHHVTYTSLRGLWEAWFKPLDNKEH